MKMKIKGTGSYLPETSFDNTQIEKIVETSDAWIRERTGITNRYLSKGETVAQMAARACKRALENAGMEPSEIDMILLATCSPEVPIPNVSCQVQAMLGAENAVSMDLNAACSGFMFALNTVYAYMKAGLCKKALVVGAEGLSKLVDWTDRTTCILFGDGAGAVVVCAQEGEDNYHFVQHANGARGSVLTCGMREIINPIYEGEGINPFIQMDGGEIFKFAVGKIPACMKELLDREKIAANEVDYYLLHQANLRIISSIARKMGEEMEKFPTNVERVGNMSSASIPVLLDEVHRKGMLQEGMRLVMSGFGAGLTFGASTIIW